MKGKHFGRLQCCEVNLIVGLSVTRRNIHIDEYYQHRTGVNVRKKQEMCSVAVFRNLIVFMLN